MFEEKYELFHFWDTFKNLQFMMSCFMKTSLFNGTKSWITSRPSPSHYMQHCCVLPFCLRHAVSLKHDWTLGQHENKSMRKCLKKRQVFQVWTYSRQWKRLTHMSTWIKRTSNICPCFAIHHTSKDYQISIKDPTFWEVLVSWRP